MKNSNCSPEIKILKPRVKPITRKVVNDSMILFDSNSEKSNETSFLETIYLYTEQDMDKETGFMMTEEDLNDFLRNNDSVKTIGPKLNMDVNYIEVDHETSEYLEMYLNILSEPSESLLNEKRKLQRKNQIDEIISSWSLSPESGIQIQIKSDKNVEIKRTIVQQTTQLNNPKKIETKQSQEIIYVSKKQKKSQLCKGTCVIY